MSRVTFRRMSCSIVLSGLACLLVGCAADDGGGGDGVPLDPGEPAGSGGQIQLGDGDIFIGGDPPPVVIGEEMEEPKTFRSPVVTGNYLWSPNPSSGKVALIDAETLATRVLSAGLEPTFLAAVPTRDHDAAAIVLNLGTSDASYFRVDAETVVTSRIAVHVGSNQWSISPSGRYAVAWSFDESGSLDPTNGLQEVSLIDLSDDVPEARRLTVGFRPSQVTFDEDETKLIAVTRQGISLIELEGEGNDWVPIDSGEGRDVSITKEGDYALVRRAGDSVVEIIALDGSEELLSLEFSSPVTDLDLAPTGRAVAVIRDESQIATFMVQEVLQDPAAIDSLEISEQIFGSAELTEDGMTAVVYTNAADSSRVTVIELDEAGDYLSHATFDTQTAVATVRVSPDGAHAVAQAKGTEGSAAGAFCVLALDDQRFPRVLGTKAPIVDIDLGNEIGVVTASRAGVHEAHLLSLSELRVDVVPLSSAPLSAGILPDLGMGFTAQNHPEGRVTFFEFGLSRVRTLTGFELSSEIVQE